MPRGQGVRIAPFGSSEPFCFGTFSFYEGRSSYTLVQAEVKSYFRELSQDVEGAYYGFYFMEFADYYARENNDEVELLKLLYASMRALANPHLDRELVRRVFELKAMVVNGEYPEVFSCAECQSREELRLLHWRATVFLCSRCAPKYRGRFRFWSLRYMPFSM